MKQKCLILGGGGFIGSHLVEGLLNGGYDVKIFDVKNFSRRNIDEYAQNIEIVEGDFNNPIDIKEALVGIDYVYHLISTTLPANSVLNPSYDVESNLIPTIKLLQFCVESNIKKVVFISSGGTVYGIPESIPIKENHASNPINSYGITKRTIESYFTLYNQLWGVNTCIFRLSNPYGKKQNPKAKQGVIPVFLYKAIHNETIEVWGDGDVVRDYIHITDVTKVLVKAIEIDTPERIYNLGSGTGTSLNKILDMIKSNLEPQLKVTYLKSRSFDVPTNVLDVRLLNERFGFQKNIDLQIGIADLHKILKNEY
ncbi:NAD-dependent epimerase/dehydratase family protein [Mucilaginibacter sp.]|uniref:NAD-dependent epimerase/dehydratase family protein n=1 Tax=Mucilaginibacter sp. TaxID=1882438 RepID=UPI0035BC8D63